MDEQEFSPEEKREKVIAELARRELARRFYSEYLAYVQGPAWKRTRMSEYLANKVQDFLEEDTGHAYDLLVIETPPQHGKSATVTESIPSWYLGKHPNNRVILASYDSDFAERFCRRNKEKLKAHGQNLFGVSIGNVDRAAEFELSNGKGRLISRGIMAGITGNPANLVIIDDPVKNQQEADSPTYRARVWEEWQSSIKSRLAAGGKAIVIMTPWHEDDLAARLLASEVNARLIRLPVEAEANDPLGRKIGEPLCPELGKDEKWLADFKKSYISDPQGGQRAWAALYQCRPRVESGNLVRRDWWRFYDPTETRMYGTEIVSVDAAFKGGDQNDYVSIQVWGKSRQDYYLRYCLNKHLDFPGTLDAIRSVVQLYPRAKTVLIEDKANGSAIIQTLQRELYCVPVNPMGGKVARVNAISAAIESGHVFLPDPAKVSWVMPFIDQFSAFPNGAHDDMCFAAGTMIATPKGDKPIELIRPGDKVLTPFGVDTVLWSGPTGVRDVVTRLGLTGTPDHPIFTYDNGFIYLQRLTGGVHYSKIGSKEMIKWKYLKLLSSMALYTDSWDLGGITLANPVQMRDVKVLRDCTSRFGSFIADGQYRQAMRFITKTATLTITTIATLSAYRAMNIGARLITTRKKSKRIWTRFGLSQKPGTVLKKAVNGIGSTLRSVWRRGNLLSASVCSAGELSSLRTATQNSVLTTAKSSMITSAGNARRSEFAHVVARSSPRSLQTDMAEQRPAAAAAERSSPTESEKRTVYNLTVEKSHLYYAGGFLVHNCDAASQALQRLIYANGTVEKPVVTEYEQREQKAEAAFNNPDILFDPYKENSSWR